MLRLIAGFNTLELFIMCSFPIVGMVLHFYFDQRKVKMILLYSTIAFSPSILGFEFFISWFYEICFMISMSSLFSLFLKHFCEKRQVIKTTIIFTILTLTIVVFLSFMQILTGTIRVKEKWITDSYRVELVYEQGFAGGALIEYKLYKCYLGGVFKKNIDAWVHEQNNENCIIYFEKENVYFNKCKGKIVRSP